VPFFILMKADDPAWYRRSGAGIPLHGSNQRRLIFTRQSSGPSAS
jgi:hypothetical protein